MTPTTESRFWSKVDKDSEGECWEWTAFKNREGYGAFRVGPVVVRSHRFAYEALVGPIPGWLVIDHLCRNRGCVNPAHMETVTREENGRRQVSYALAKTHCPRGHEYSAENTYREPGRTHRQCRKCHAAQQRLYLERLASK